MAEIEEQKGERSSEETIENMADIEEQKGEERSQEERKICICEESNVVVNELIHQSQAPDQSCIDKLRVELTCAICLEICFEPTTTPCGHSFCKTCLESSVDKWHKVCPKCYKSISNINRPFSVNIVTWNTIQLLFPKEVKAKIDRLKKPPPRDPSIKLDVFVSVLLALCVFYGIKFLITSIFDKSKGPIRGPFGESFF